MIRPLLPIGLMVSILAGIVVAQEEEEPSRDRIVLQNGTVVKGRIVQASDDTVTLAFGFGGRVEFKRKDLRSVHRVEGDGTSNRVGGDGEAKARETWNYFVFHGESVVGFRKVIRTRVRRKGRPGTLLKDEVLFRNAGQAQQENAEACRILTLEFIEDTGAFRTLYYRETGMGTESIIDARFENGCLQYTWVRGGKRTYHTEALGAEVLFPIQMWMKVAALATASNGCEVAHRVWDPRDRKVIPSGARPFPSCWVAVGAVKVRVTPIRVHGPRGGRFRWLDSRGRTLKEYLNGETLVAVATTRPGPIRGEDGMAVHPRRELAWVRVLLDPETGIVLRTPGSGWTISTEPLAGAVFTLVNQELRSRIAVFLGGREAPWPGPAPDRTTRPMAFGGRPGEGWSNSVEEGKRERRVRRTETDRYRIAALVDTPPDLAPATVLDFAAVLRGIQIPD